MKRALTLLLALMLLTGSAEGLPSRATATDTWSPVNGPTGGSVSALAISPDYAYDHTAYAGLRGKGIYRTDDGGLSWKLTSPDDWVIVDLAISPAYATDQALFAVTGFGTTGYTVYRSTDAGGTWQAPAMAPSGGLQNLTYVVVSPSYAADRTLYVIGASQVYRSMDGGITFTEAGGWFSTHALTDLAFSPAYAVDRTLYATASGGDPAGLYKSTDGGTAWTPTSLTGNLSTVAVSPDYASDQTVAAISTDDGRIYISRDRGESWSASTITLSGSADQHTLLFSPTFATDRIMLAASAADPGAYRSTDGGATWSPAGWYDAAQPYLGGFIGGSVFALALAPNTASDAAAFAGTSSGIYRSSDRGEHWYPGSKGLARLTIRALAVAPNDPNTLLAGTAFFERALTDNPDEDAGSLQLSTDGGGTWRDVSGRLDQVQQVAFSPDFAADRTAFAVTGLTAPPGFRSGGIYRSTDGGQNWSLVSSGLIGWAVAISPDFAADRTVWVYGSSATESGVFVSTDGGDSWTLLAPRPAGSAGVIIPSPNYAVDRTIFAGTGDGGVQRSTDGGQTWTQVLSHTTTALAVSPLYAASQTIYAGVIETLDGPGALYRSTDGGATWQKLSTGIPAAFNGGALTITALRFAGDGSVLAGVSYSPAGGAVYRSVDGGQAWQLVASGLSAYQVFDVASASHQRDVEPHVSLTLYAGTNACARAAPLPLVGDFAGAGGGLYQFGITQFDPAEAGSWASAGPRGGQAQALAVSPNFVGDGVAFSGEWRMGRAGDQSGLGIFKSSDWGATWQASSSGIESAPFPYGSAVHGYAFSPNFATDRTVFAATWAGLFKSTDGGATWQWLPRATFGAPGSMASVAVAPNYATGGHVMAGGGWGGLFISRDGGVNWTPDYSVISVSAIAYSGSFATSQMAFVAGGNGVYKTLDGGTTWTRMLTYPVSSLILSPRFDDDHLMYAGGDVLYISSDEATSWITRTIAPGVTLISALAISPNFNDDRTLYAGTNVGLYRSTDGGLNWSVMAGYSGVPVLSLAISPGWPGHSVLLVGTARGVERIVGSAGSPAQGLATLSARSIALSADETLWVAGTSDHGIYASADPAGRPAGRGAGTGASSGGAAWTPIGLQGGTSHYSIADVSVSPNYAGDRTLFAAWNSSVSIGGSVYRTTDGGATWSPVYSTDSVGALAISPEYVADRTVYATGNTGRVLRSADGGDTWAQVGTWPPGVSYPALRVALTPDYPADGTIFAGGGQGFWRLPSGETTWQPAASGLISATTVSAIAVAPNYTDSQTLLAVANWISGTALHGGVFRSTDGGVNWQAASVGLPHAELRGVAFSPNYAADHTAYAISTSQLYRSIDGGQSWTAIGAPPGWPALSRVAVTRAGHVIVASSAGVWRYGAATRDILIDGNFEAGSGWDLPTTPYPAAYSSRIVYDGLQSLRLGIDVGGNVDATSSAQQTVTIPISATLAELSVHWYGASSEEQMAAPDPIALARQAAGDAQYLRVVDPASGATLETLFWTLSNTQTWRHGVFDLTAYAGQSIVLHFGVTNDGVGGRTAMVVDNASLVVGALPYRVNLPLVLKSLP
ncbi:MAG TPA: hypothetical protein VJ793_03165 [Anaerolineae bacterium]|nr:hypothetical protein [Anaerolineae bacterium]